LQDACFSMSTINQSFSSFLSLTIINAEQKRKYHSGFQPPTSHAQRQPLRQ
jgi:hypothetical protein